MLSEKRNMEAAQRFFKQAVSVVGHTPDQVTTDGHSSYPRAIRETMGSNVQHRTSKYLNNRLEQDHREVKQRYHPMRGFGTFEAAARFCCDARRITELSPPTLHNGRIDLALRTTTNFPRSACNLASTASLIARDGRVASIPWS